MVVRLTDGRDAVRAYVSEHAGRGLDHVRELLRGDRDAIMALIGDLSEDEAAYKIAPEEWSISEAMQHLNASFPRSTQRLRDLTSGRPYTAPPPASGSLPDTAPASFDETRRTFSEGEADVLSILDAANPDADRSLTADHVTFGPFDWLEWAVYSQHVHTHDHVGQIEAVRREIEKRRGG